MVNFSSYCLLFFSPSVSHILHLDSPISQPGHQGGPSLKKSGNLCHSTPFNLLACFICEDQSRSVRRTIRSMWSVPQTAKSCRRFSTGRRRLAYICAESLRLSSINSLSHSLLVLFEAAAWKPETAAASWQCGPEKRDESEAENECGEASWLVIVHETSSQDTHK